MLLIIINALIICYGLGRMFVFLFFWQNVNISLISGRYNFCTFILFRDIYTIFFLGCYLLRYHMLSNFGINFSRSNFRGRSSAGGLTRGIELRGIFRGRIWRSFFRGWTLPEGLNEWIWRLTWWFWPRGRWPPNFSRSTIWRSLWPFSRRYYMGRAPQRHGKQRSFWPFRDCLTGRAPRCHG